MQGDAMLKITNVAKTYPGALRPVLTEASLQLGTQLETRIRILDTQGIVFVDSR
jgi:hypothetical protein